jgi:hypothetical protein
MLVYRVPFVDAPVTVRENANVALEDLNNPAAGKLRYFQDPVHRDLLAPLLANPLLRPGPAAGGFVPASGPRTTEVERRNIQPIGDATGCHINAGHSKGDESWVADHQRPTKLVEHTLVEGDASRLYPQCAADSRKQGSLVADIIRMWTGRNP